MTSRDNGRASRLGRVIGSSSDGTTTGGAQQPLSGGNPGETGIYSLPESARVRGTTAPTASSPADTAPMAAIGDSGDSRYVPADPYGVHSSMRAYEPAEPSYDDSRRSTPTPPRPAPSTRPTRNEELHDDWQPLPVPMDTTGFLGKLRIIGALIDGNGCEQSWFIRLGAVFGWMAMIYIVIQTGSGPFGELVDLITGNLPAIGITALAIGFVGMVVWNIRIARNNREPVDHRPTRGNHR